MPAAWSAKDERQYGHILKSCRSRGRYDMQRCKAIAGATVNTTRRREGRTLSEFTDQDKNLLVVFAIAAGLMALKLVSP